MEIFSIIKVAMVQFNSRINKNKNMLSNQFTKFFLLLKVLDENQVDYILIGGVTVILHGFERLTRDVDLFIKSTPQNVSQLQ